MFVERSRNEHLGRSSRCTTSGAVAWILFCCSFFAFMHLPSLPSPQLRVCHDQRPGPLWIRLLPQTCLNIPRGLSIESMRTLTDWVCVLDGLGTSIVPAICRTISRDLFLVLCMFSVGSRHRSRCSEAPEPPSKLTIFPQGLYPVLCPRVYLISPDTPAPETTPSTPARSFPAFFFETSKAQDKDAPLQPSWLA